jgi:hypothetical protein
MRKTGYAAFIALVAVVLAGYLLFPRGFMPSEGALIPDRGAARIERIEISRQGDAYTVVLTKTGGIWKLIIDPSHGYPARTDKLTSLIQALARRRTLSPPGRVDEKKIGIGTEGSYSVEVFSGDGSKGGLQSETIFFGNTDATGTWMYAKRKSDSRVFRTESDLEGFLDISAASWAKLDIFSETLSKTDIQRVLFVKNGRTRQFLAGSGDAIHGFESALARIECLDVTNLKGAETEYFEVEYGDLKKDRIGLAPLGDVWILSDGATGGFYVISDDAKRALESPLGAD